MADKIYIKNCSYCGEKFEASHWKTNYCSPGCKRDGINKRQMEDYYRKKGKQRQDEIQAAWDYRKHARSLAEINAEARAHGMTYGQYMVYLYFH